jgi:hypothetical protein
LSCFNIYIHLRKKEEEEKAKAKKRVVLLKLCTCLTNFLSHHKKLINKSMKSLRESNLVKVLDQEGRPAMEETVLFGTLSKAKRTSDDVFDDLS